MYSHDVVFAGVPISIVDATKSLGGAVGVRIVPILAAGESPKAAYADLAIDYNDSGPLILNGGPGAQTRIVNVDHPGWVAAFGAAHRIRAGESGRTYRVTVAEQCKELQFPTRSESFEATSSGAGAVTATTEAALALTAAAPALATDGASVAGARAMRVSVNAGVNTINAAGKLDAYRYINGAWSRLPDLDLSFVVAGFSRYAFAELETPIPNGRIAWRPNAMTLSAGATVELRYEVLS